MPFKISDITGAATEGSQTVTPRASDLFEGDQAVGTTSYKIDFPTLLAGYYLDALAQIKGYTAATVAEVEANSRALRATLRDIDVGGGLDGEWLVNRHAIGIQCDFSLTTSAVSNIAIAQMFWETAGLAVINKVNVAQSTGALAGTRNGAGAIRMFRGQMNALPDRDVTIIPGITSNALGGLLAHNQVPPKIVVTSMGTANTGAGLDATVFNLNTNLVGEANPACQNAAGNNDLLLSPLWDAAVTVQPLILLPWEGINIDVSIPAAGTSQSVYFAVNIQWEEWLPVARGNLP